DDAELHFSLGNALSDKGRMAESIAEYRKAIQIKKDFATAHYGLGRALAHNDQLDEAIVEYREAIRYKPEYAEAHCNLGQVLIGQGRFAQGLAARKRGHEFGSKIP